MRKTVSQTFSLDVPWFSLECFNTSSTAFSLQWAMYDIRDDQKPILQNKWRPGLCEGVNGTRRSKRILAFFFFNKVLMRYTARTSGSPCHMCSAYVVISTRLLYTVHGDYCGDSFSPGAHAICLFSLLQHLVQYQGGSLTPPTADGKSEGSTSQVSPQPTAGKCYSLLCPSRTILGTIPHLVLVFF